jgi:hypothetical protein
MQVFDPRYTRSHLHAWIKDGIQLQMTVIGKGVELPVQLEVHEKSGCSMMTKGWIEIVNTAKLKENDICKFWFFYTHWEIAGSMLRLINN